MASELKSAERRRRLRDALVDAAERAIEKDGLRGLKARDLAHEVGCAVGAIYNAVTDLDDLVYAVNARTLAALEDKLTAAGATGKAGKDVAGRLVLLALAYLDYAAANTRRWRAVFDHQPMTDRGLPDWYLADQMRLFSYVEAPLKVLQPKADTALIARSLVSAVHGIVVLGLEEKLQRIPLGVLRGQVTLMVQAIARGLAHKS